MIDQNNIALCKRQTAQLRKDVDYVVVTPAYNEQEYIQLTIDSMVSQNVRPRLWVIVDDGSTDRTWDLISSAGETHSWIKAYRRKEADKSDEDGLIAASEAKAFLHGLKIAIAGHPNPSYIVKLDADLQFGPDYFSALFEEFDRDTKLGMASGVIHEYVGSELVREKVSVAHTRGASKVYRYECYQAIGGVHPVFGWDVIDEMLARDLGWHATSFDHIPLTHLRRMATRNGRFSGCVRNGYMAYYIGMSPLRMFLRALFRLVVARDAVQCIGLAHGYFSNYFRRAERLPDKDIRRLVREHQWVTARSSLGVTPVSKRKQ